MRVDCGFSISSISPGKPNRLLLAGLLVVTAVLCTTWTGPADAAHAANRTSHRHRQGVRTWQSETHFKRPAFKPKLTVNVYNAAQFWRAWNRIRPGEEIDAHGVVFLGEAVFRKRLSRWAEVHFDSRTRFMGTPGANRPAAWIDRCRFVRFYGGNLSNPRGGAGIIISDSSWVTWWNFIVHDTANTGLFVRGTHQANRDLDLKGQIDRWGLNLALDPHREKGTGLHGANLADSPWGITDSRFALDVHDGAAGAGIEAGGKRETDFLARNSFYVRCRNLTKMALRATAGNCVQLWGVHVMNNVFRYIDAESVTGRPFETGGMFSGQSLRTNRVVYGRAYRTNLNPLVGPIHWDRQFGTVFRNILPLH